MKKTSKILALALVAVMLLTSLMVIPASAAEETKTYVFESKSLGAQAQGTYADGQQVAAGTDNFFTLVMSAKVKVDSSNKTFDDDYSSDLRVSWGDKSSSGKNLVTFTVPSAATVKIWWVCGGDGRTYAIWNAAGSEVSKLSTETAKNALYIDTFDIAEAGTYSLATIGGSNYLFKIEVSYKVDTCAHTGGTATCKDLAVCDLCGKPYGELSTEHKFDNGSCTVCGEPDPDACQHTNKNAATCLLPETCADCGETFGEALGHEEVVDDAVAPTCTEKGLKAGSHCSRCGETIVKQEEVDSLGHTLTFTTTIPTAELKGKTTAVCSVCDYTFESGEVGIMTGGEYILDASALDGIAQYTLFDGEVKVVEGLFACHLSYKYRTDDGRENKDTYIDWEDATHRMNFGGTSELLNNGDGDSAVKNGGLKNFIQITTTGETTITIYWCAAGDGRQMGVYSFDGQLEVATNETSVKNGYYRSVLTVPAGTWLIGGYVPEGASKGGNYVNRIVVDVHEHEWKDATCEEPKHCDCGAEEGEALGHTWTDATCTAPKTCSVCGETEGEALGHTWTDATCTTPKTCSACGATEGDGLGHDYDRGTCGECGGVDPEYTIWNRIIDAIMAFIQKILGFFKKA